MTRTGRWTIGVVGGIAALVLLGLGIWYYGRPAQEEAPKTTPVPTPSNKENGAAEQTPPAATETQYVSRRGVSITLDRSLRDQLVTSPLTLTGKIPGNWSFEGSFPVELRDDGGATIVQTPARLEGDWMTTEDVPFTVTLTFTTTATNGELILRKDNPSGLPDNDDELTIPVRFRQE